MKRSQGEGVRDRAVSIIKALRRAVKGLPAPAAAHIVAKYGRNPYLILVSCILSLRTRDVVSYPASVRLFEVADTPQKMIKLSISQVEELIKSVGFYRQKARQIQRINKELIESYGGKAPKDREKLLALPGVGPKTANLVLGEAFNIPAICVDTHVHRLSNKSHLGLVNTKTPEKTLAALENIVPKKYWIEFSRLMVTWGQNGCKSNRSCKCQSIFEG